MLSRLWHLLSSDGLPPYKAIEQLSYLLVLKQDEIARWRSGSTSPVLWNDLQSTPQGHLIDAASEAIAGLQASSGTPLLRAAHLSISKASLLREVLTLIDTLFVPACSGERHARLYDALLSLAEEAAQGWAAPGGKFYTPHHIAHLLCSLVRPRPGERIGDLACGNGRLLSAAHAQVLRRGIADPDVVHFASDGQPLPLEETHWGERCALLEHTQFVGVDIDESAALQAWVLLRFLGISCPPIYSLDALSEQAGRWLTQEGGEVRFDVLLANPPYTAHIDRETLDGSLRALNTAKAELLFLGLALQWLRPGGRAAIIVPDSVLFNQQKAAASLRRTLVREHRLHAVISLPAGVFAPYTNVKTSILVLTHSGVTDRIWCYAVEHDGYTLDKRRQATPQCSDLPDLMIKYGLRFTDSLLTLLPSAFIDGDTELQWNNIEPGCRSYHYARPLIEGAQVKGTLAEPTLHPKDWEVESDQLDEHCALLPTRYRPTSSESPRPGFPPRSAAQAATAKAPRFSVPGVFVPPLQNWSQLADWYVERLQALRTLSRLGHISAKQHLAALRLFAAIRLQFERRFCTPFRSPHWP
jgi:type I restriction enzyme M protein